MGKGNCLNYLGSSKFDMSNTRYSTTTSVPKAVKRVHEVFEKPTFLKDIDGADIKQGALGDCWYIASLSALANVEGAVKRVCVEYDTRKSVVIQMESSGTNKLTVGYRRRNLRLRLLPGWRMDLLDC